MHDEKNYIGKRDALKDVKYRVFNDSLQYDHVELEERQRLNQLARNGNLDYAEVATLD